MADPRRAPSPPSKPSGVRWRRWTLAAACLVALVAAWSWRTHDRDGSAYGIDDVPQRLAEVQSFRLRGWQWIHWSDDDKQPPIRIPIEIIVKRPGKFRYNNWGISFQAGQKPKVVNAEIGVGQLEPGGNNLWCNRFMYTALVDNSWMSTE